MAIPPAAALMGQGVALGWTPLIGSLIDKAVLTERGYFLVRRQVGDAQA